MAYSIKTKEEAISLRKKGYSIREIADFLGIALSTSSTWLHNIQLNKRAENRLKKRRIFGQHNARKTALIKRGKMLATLNQSTIKEINNIRVTQQLSKLLCSFLFWTEGSKDNSLVSFSNSDPKMIKTFMYLLRKSFKINETKFRVLIHIHEYHDNQKLIRFWSKVTGIPPKQFNNSYKKPHTKKRKREDYKGCVAVRYYDYKIALELNSIYNMFAKSIGA